MTSPDPGTLGRTSSWEGIRALVTGFGASAFAAADTLTHLGARVIVTEAGDSPERRDQATLLEILGADVRLGPEALTALPGDLDLVVTSPEWRPEAPLLAAAVARGLPIWGEVELAWRLRGDAPAPWLAVTGGSGSTGTVSMLDAILRAEGLNSAAVGNGRIPVLEAVMNPDGFDVLAVELTSAQLHWSSSISAEAGAVLSLRPGSQRWPESEQAYAAASARVYRQARLACVYNVQEPATERLVREADVVEGCRAIGFTLALPEPGMIGVVDDVIADRAFVANRSTSAAELCSIHDVAPAGAEQLAAALAAAALARAHGVSVAAVRAGVRTR